MSVDQTRAPRVRPPVGEVAERATGPVRSDPLQDPLVDPLSDPLQQEPIRRKERGEASGDALQNFGKAVAGGGGDVPYRREMESLFGESFAGVTAATGRSDALRALGAEAATRGERVAFAASQPSRAVVGHELAHVLQQRRGGGGVQAKGGLSVPGSAAEREADEAGARVAAGRPVTVTGHADAPIQRLVKLRSEMKPAAFRSMTARRGAKRGPQLSTIDRWLDALDQASDDEAQEYAGQQVLDACAKWLAVHGREPKKKERKSVTQRRGPILGLATRTRMLMAKLTGGQHRGTVDDGDGEVETGGLKDDTEDLLEGVFDSLAGGSGITGDLGDVTLPDKDDDASIWSREGAGLINDANADLLEGTNVLTGILHYKQALDTLGDPDKDGWDKTEAMGKALSSGGEMIHGGFKFAKGIALHEGGDSAKWTQVGDIGAGFADGTATIAGTISFVKRIRDARKKAEEEGGLTGAEKTDLGLELTQMGLETVKGGLNTAKDIIKIGTEVGGKDAMGMTAEGAKSAISGLATASGVISIVTGTIDIVHGGIKAFRAHSAKNEVKRARSLQQGIIEEVQGNVALVGRSIRGLMWDFDLDEYEVLLDRLEDLEDRVETLEGLVEQYRPAFESMDLLQNRRMEDAGMKMAKGATAVVSGALLVSGVGAPVAIAFAAIGGILALGHAGVKLARNRAANRLTAIAQQLSTDGKPKAEIDPDMSYREMERRVFKCYFNHMPEVITKRPPAGMSKGQFGDVRTFVQQDKYSRIGHEQKIPIGAATSAHALSETEKRDHWLEVVQGGKVQLKEKPKGFRSKLSFKTSASAHKSSVAQDAAAADVAEALFKLAASAFDAKQQRFVDAPVVPTGQQPTEPAEVSRLKKATLDGLLGAADIDAKRWGAWVVKAGGNVGTEFEENPRLPDEAKLKDKIKGHVG